MRLASQRCCGGRITAVVSAGTLIGAVGFEPMFRMPAEVELDSVFAEFSFLCALCRRFGVVDRNWVLRINLPHLRGPIAADAYDQFYDQIVALAEAFGDQPAI